MYKKERKEQLFSIPVCDLLFFGGGGRSLHSLVLTLFSTKATPKLINKIAPNMSTNSKKEKEALGKN